MPPPFFVPIKWGDRTWPRLFLSEFALVFSAITR
ncbi:hypothetical protein SAMN05421764_11420 [Donghicola eburneus]|nr:hypothetical protein SAMN05421764_11420 [Donghicola eburneus]